MKDLLPSLKQIYSEERFLFILMIINAVASIALAIADIINLNPSAVVVKVGYGDISGYINGSWIDYLSFILLAIIFGIFHNLIALRIFKKRGAGMTKFFLIITSALIVGSFIVLLRLLGKV